MYKAYHIDKITFVKTYIGNYIVGINDLSEYARNDDFSIVLKDVEASVVEELDSAKREKGQLIGFEKDGVIFWYGLITATKFIETNLTYKITIRNILAELKNKTYNQIFGYSVVTASYLFSYDLSAWGQGTQYYINVMGVFDAVKLRLFQGLITGYALNIPSSYLSYMQEFHYYHNSMLRSSEVEKLNAFDFLNLFCKAWGIVPRIENNTIKFYGLPACTSIATYNNATRYNFPLKDYNDYDFNEREKAEGKGIAVYISEYYKDLMAYPRLPAQNQIGEFANDVTNIEGYSSSSGFYPLFKVETAFKHGLLEEEYITARLYSKNIGAWQNEFGKKIDEEYELGRYLKDGTFYVYSDTEIRISSSDYEDMPRLKASYSIGGVVCSNNGSGKVLMTYPYSHGINQMGVITITNAGAYNGVYYGTGLLSERTFTIIDATRIRLSINYTAPATHATSTCIYTYIMKSMPLDALGGHVNIYLFQYPIWASYSPTIEITNTERKFHPELYTYDGIYTKGTGINQWQWIYDPDGSYIQIYVISAVHELGEYELYNRLPVIKKPETSTGEIQISFPKHFFFYRNATLLNGYLLQVDQVHPISTVYSANYLYHLLKANTASNALFDEDFTIDDNIALPAVIHKELGYNVPELKTVIKQQELK